MNKWLFVAGLVGLLAADGGLFLEQEFYLSDQLVRGSLTPVALARLREQAQETPKTPETPELYCFDEETARQFRVSALQYFLWVLTVGAIVFLGHRLYCAVREFEERPRGLAKDLEIELFERKSSINN